MSSAEEIESSSQEHPAPSRSPPSDSGDLVDVSGPSNYSNGGRRETLTVEQLDAGQPSLLMTVSANTALSPLTLMRASVRRSPLIAKRETTESVSDVPMPIFSPTSVVKSPGNQDDAYRRLVTFEADKTEETDANTATSRNPEERKRIAEEAEKVRYKRNVRLPPRLPILSTLMSTFMTFVLLAITTLLVGIPPLYMTEERYRRVYVAIMVPILTVVITVMHYYVTEYPMRQVAQYLLHLAKDVESHHLAMENRVEEARRAMEEEAAMGIPGDDTQADLHGSVVQTPGASIRSTHAASIAKRKGSPQLVGRSPRRLTAFLAEAARRETKWMDQQLAKLSRLHENAVHPEVQSQQKLLKYFLSVFFAFHASFLALVTEEVAAIASVSAFSRSAAASFRGSAPQSRSGTPALRTPSHTPKDPEGMSLVSPTAHAASSADDAFGTSTALEQPQRSLVTIDTDALTFRPHTLLSPNSTNPTALASSRTAVKLPVFTPLSPPTVHSEDATGSVRGAPRSEGVDTAAADSTPATVDPSTRAAPARARSGPDQSLSEVDETVKVDVTDTAVSSLQPSTVQKNRQALSALSSTTGTPMRGSSAVPVAAADAAAAASAGESDLLAKQSSSFRGSGTPMVPQQSLVVTSAPPTLTLYRGRRFLGDTPWVFFFMRVSEGAAVHTRTTSTATHRPDSPGARVTPVSKIIGFEALAGPRGAANAEATAVATGKVHTVPSELPPPVFSEDRLSHRPYISFYVDVGREKRRALSMLEQVKLEFAHCKAEATAVETDEFDAEEGDASHAPDSATANSHVHTPIMRQETAQVAREYSASLNRQDTIEKSGESRRPPLSPSAGGHLASSYVLSWKAFVERPMRLTFLPVCLVTDQDEAPGNSACPPPAPGASSPQGSEPFAASSGASKTVWAPVLECLVDDVLCVLRSADVRLDSSTHEVVGVDLHGVSIEDLSRSGSSVLMSSSFTSQTSGDKRSSTKSPTRQPHAGARERRGRAAEGENQPRAGQATIGQLLSEAVVVSNVVSGDDEQGGERTPRA